MYLYLCVCMPEKQKLITSGYAIKSIQVFAFFEISYRNYHWKILKYPCLFNNEATVRSQNNIIGPVFQISCLILIKLSFWNIQTTLIKILQFIFIKHSQNLEVRIINSVKVFFICFQQQSRFKVLHILMAFTGYRKYLKIFVEQRSSEYSL